MQPDLVVQLRALVSECDDDELRELLAEALELAVQVAEDEALQRDN